MKPTMPTPSEPDATIARYYSAYALANGANSEMPKVRYERGWFVFASIGFGQCEKFRRRAFEDMISRLARVPATEITTLELDEQSCPGDGFQQSHSD